MYKFLPYMTNDYSVGLYNEDADDIYHSAFGALSEAFEKFVDPVLKFDIFNTNKGIKVLDICYGIGYNTKAFLNEFLNSNNIECEILIDCVDNDKNLMLLSPFISTKINLIKRLLYKKKLFKNIENYNQAKKITNNFRKISCSHKISYDVNMLLIKNLIKNFGTTFLENLSKEFGS
ncbi:MAG: hypothetical protein NC200_06950, partial [Candidatus Gastranaerophilales bacterium]|nr:hypothetical protein [Candidatus Gastranaerophilales bacterium]